MVFNTVPFFSCDVILWSHCQAPRRALQARLSYSAAVNEPPGRGPGAVAKFPASQTACSADRGRSAGLINTGAQIRLSQGGRQLAF